MFDGLPPQPVRLVVLGLGVGGGAYETVPPPDGLEVLNVFSPYHTRLLLAKKVVYLRRS